LRVSKWTVGSGPLQLIISNLNPLNIRDDILSTGFVYRDLLLSIMLCLLIVILLS